ncbi:unnamed protein product, partial [Meganyctiphanes norvegica]
GKQKDDNSKKEMEQFTRNLEKMVSQSRQDDSPEELRRRLPPLPPGMDWEDFGIDPYDLDYDDLRHTMRVMKKSGPGDRFLDFFKMNRLWNRKKTTHAPAPTPPPPTYNQRMTWGSNKTEQQRAWTLPVLVQPDEVDEPIPMETEDNEEEIILIKSDAEFYRVTEQTSDGSLKHHSILKMMSEIPDSMIAKGSTQTKHQASSTFNLFMGDVSGSMSGYWPSVVSGWNAHVRPTLCGRTAIMTFGAEVTTKRSGSTRDCYEITQRDFDSSSTDLTGGLQAIVEEVYKCKEKFINVFFVTDGSHNATQCQPDEVIEKMKAPEGKICDVFVLGAGSGFPVQYSVNIRSRLHSGRSNLPTIFWAQSYTDMVTQMKDIASHLGQTGSSNTMKLNIP